MSEQEELPLVVALTVVLQGCKNQYEQVLRKTNAHPAYREAIPVVERFLDELQGLDEPYRGAPGRRDEHGNWLVGEGGPLPPRGESS